MKTQSAILICLSFFFISVLVYYYLAQLTSIASITLAFIFSFIVLYTLVPVANVIGNVPDLWLGVYAFFTVCGFIFVLYFIMSRALTENRRDTCRGRCVTS